MLRTRSLVMTHPRNGANWNLGVTISAYLVSSDVTRAVGITASRNFSKTRRAPGISSNSASNSRFQSGM